MVPGTPLAPARDYAGRVRGLSGDAWHSMVHEVRTWNEPTGAHGKEGGTGLPSECPGGIRGRGDTRAAAGRSRFYLEAKHHSGTLVEMSVDRTHVSVRLTRTKDEDHHGPEGDGSSKSFA